MESVSWSPSGRRDAVLLFQSPGDLVRTHWIQLSFRMTEFVTYSRNACRQLDLMGEVRGSYIKLIFSEVDLFDYFVDMLADSII